MTSIDMALYNLARALSWRFSLLGMWFYRRAVEREIARTGSCRHLIQ